METPKQKLQKLEELNGKEGFYGLHNQFAELIKKRNYDKATNIMKSLNKGFLWTNERLVHSEIYNLLLDGLSVKNIKEKYKLV